MERQKIYVLLLDLFLLSETIANHVLRSRVQRIALDVLCRKSSLTELRLLLLLSRDLGYIDLRTFAFLDRKIAELKA